MDEMPCCDGPLKANAHPNPPTIGATPADSYREREVSASQCKAERLKSKVNGRVPEMAR